MDKKIAGLLGTVAALGTISSAQAAPVQNANDALRANSYAELLEPIPNAVALLQAMDEQQSGAPQQGKAQLAQYYHHHHHHHHHHGFVVRTPFGAFGTYRRHHHHHHHHHHGYYRY